MNTSDSVLLIDPQPDAHIVYSYTDDSQLIKVVAFFATQGLRNGESVGLIMEHSHCEPILRQLHDQGFDLTELESSGRLTWYSAEGILAKFAPGGVVDECAIKAEAAREIQIAKNASPTGRLRVFGEAVNLLWSENSPKNFNQTRRLEELWDEICRTYKVPIFCAYALGGARPNMLPDPLLACHSEVLV